MSNLAKDWKDELTEGELQALQYEVSLNGVKEEIRHVLDSEMAKKDDHLMPQQMYEAVKMYETYVAQNKRLDGKGTSTSVSQQKTTGQSSGYKPRFHKMTTFMPLLVGQMMRPTTLWVPRHRRTTTPSRLNLPIRKMRGRASLATSRRLYRMTLFCRSRSLMPCECKR